MVINLKSDTGITLDKPLDKEMCVSLKASTPARICVGRSGPRLKTQTLLKFRADHSIAMDAVWSSVNEGLIDELKFIKVQTLVKDKDEYITRPDLGKKFSQETIEYLKDKCLDSPEVQIIVGDGLSSMAINANIKDIYPIILDGLNAKGYKIGTPIFVKYARVATMDSVSEALKAKVTIILIGERPGLATGESMSSYMAYEASTKKPESQRTVISNIHRNGLPPVEAGAQIVHLIEIIMKERNSGVELKI
jgi:ethanolamine ammonia-lyase small subunit